jgi:hypothetical protein
MWGIGLVTVGLGAVVWWWTIHVSPYRRLTRYLKADQNGVVVGRDDLISWRQIREVFVETTAGGPYFDDFFVGLVVDGRRAIRIPDRLAPVVLPWIQKLPGFDNEALLRATRSAEKAVFPCWKRGAA